MIERLRRWWDRQLLENLDAGDEGESMDEIQAMDKGAEEVLKQSTELADARELLTEARQKNVQADTKIADFQRRIKAENDRRLDMARGERRS